MIINKIIKNREDRNALFNLFRPLPDELFLKLMFRVRMGEKLDLDNPKSFNEKIQWLKIHDRDPIYPTMVDKYEAKQFFASIIGTDYIIPTYGVWNSFDEIDFGKLPDKFVLKCTHDSGGVVICQDKNDFDMTRARQKITKSLNQNYYWVGREWPYKNLERRVLAEQYLSDCADCELRDYKFFCFDGVPKLLLIATGRQSDKETCFDFFDMDGKHLDIHNGHPNADLSPHLPKCFEEMKMIARTASKTLPTSRVDLYEVDGKVFFGEMTLYHWGGFKRFEPKLWEMTMGDWIMISD